MPGNKAAPGDGRRDGDADAGGGERETVVASILTTTLVLRRGDGTIAATETFEAPLAFSSDQARDWARSLGVHWGAAVKRLLGVAQQEAENR